MRYLLIIVIILNTLRALGTLFSYFSQIGIDSLAKIGGALDMVVFPVSMVIIATALLQIYPSKEKPNSIE